MIELWRSLRDQLKVEVQYEVHEASDPPVSIHFTITNAAHGEISDSPRILFENVLLRVGVPPDFHLHEVGSLAPEESASYEHRCRYSDLPEVKYDIEGTVSPEEFFRVRRASSLPNAHPQLTSVAYLQVFNEMMIHGWLDSTIKLFPVPGADTTLGEMQSLAGSLDKPASEVRDAQSRLSRLSAFVRRQDREAVSSHTNIVESYLRSTTQGMGQLRQLLNSANTRQISSTVAQLIDSLEKEARTVNQATEELMAQLGLSDQEIGYSYRKGS